MPKAIQMLLVNFQVETPTLQKHVASLAHDKGFALPLLTKSWLAIYPSIYRQPSHIYYRPRGSNKAIVPCDVLAPSPLSLQLLAFLIELLPGTREIFFFFFFFIIIMIIIIIASTWIPRLMLMLTIARRCRRRRRSVGTLSGEGGGLWSLL